MDSFRDNLKELYRHYSTWVAFFCSTAFAYWLQMTPDQQAAVFEVLPYLKPLAPLAAFMAFAVARGLPQGPKE